ncbi:ABC transporter permease [Cellulomonas sp. SLBN-39]|uniref:ABC transporter permease n=1 Tax=Cellulomonas sp. SLBN-39 TaxID=2768446 RepID=UPI00114F5494|nr:FtsX-like permease family protein [Cellulomonas sp. SLBN-39]TQL02155.1 putative ABC transport system permease protein [Cellulomonas sp. SLBN-39]
MLREAVASAVGQPVPSLLTVAMVAGMCAAALLTSGQTAAAEAAALARIDAVGTRSVVVRADVDAGVTSAVVDRVRALEGVESVVALGPIVDARNSNVPAGRPVPVRAVYGDLGDVPSDGLAAASDLAVQALGLVDGSGSIVTTDGRELVVVAGLDVPDHLREMEPLVVIPAASTGPVAVLVVVADEPQTVAPLSAAVVGLVAADDPSAVTLETSAELAAIRAAVGGELVTYGRSAVLGILAVAGLLVAANLFGLVQLRRKDFGRRRALGASRGQIVTLLLTQVGVLAVAGAVLGTTAVIVPSMARGAPVPGLAFVVAVAVAAVLTALLAALGPATVAANRDPLHEMRIP